MSSAIPITERDPSAPVATPIQPAERILALDVIRGFALAGILIMNMPYFGMSFFTGGHASQMWPDELNRLAEKFREAFFSGKFNSIFSFLFALGFTLQLGRMYRAGVARPEAIYLRRLFVLFLIGLFHATVMWIGDILHIYAVLGLLLLFLNRLSDRALITFGALSLVMPAVAAFIRMEVVPAGYFEIQAHIAAAWEVSNNQAFGMGSLLDAVKENAREFVYLYSDRSRLYDSIVLWFQLFVTVALGLLAGRGNWIQAAEHKLPTVRRLQWIAAIVGIPMGVLYVMASARGTSSGFTTVDVVASFAYAVSRLALATFYLTMILRLCYSPRWKPWLRPIALAGRMPLTNYLMQTVIGTFIFYGWGLGLWGHVGPLGCLALALGVFFLVQVPVSVVWFRYFRFGPAEYVWRRLSYHHALQGRSTTSAS